MVSSSCPPRRSSSPRRAARHAIATIVAIWSSATVASSTSAGDTQNLRRESFKKRRLTDTEVQAMFAKIKSHAEEEEQAQKMSTKRGRRRLTGNTYCTQTALSDTSSYATGCTSFYYPYNPVECTASPNDELTYSVAASGGDISGTASLFASYQSAFTNPLSLPTKPFCFEFSIADSSKWQAVSWCGGAMLLLATALASCWSVCWSAFCWLLAFPRL